MILLLPQKSDEFRPLREDYAVIVSAIEETLRYRSI